MRTCGCRTQRGTQHKPAHGLVRRIDCGIRSRPMPGSTPQTHVRCAADADYPHIVPRPGPPHDQTCPDVLKPHQGAEKERPRVVAGCVGHAPAWCLPSGTSSTAPSPLPAQSRRQVRSTKGRSWVLVQRCRWRYFAFAGGRAARTGQFGAALCTEYILVIPHAKNPQLSRANTSAGLGQGGKGQRPRGGDLLPERPSQASKVTSLKFGHMGMASRERVTVEPGTGPGPWRNNEGWDNRTRSQG